MVIKITVGKSGFTENFVLRVWEAETKDDLGAYVAEEILVEKNALGVPTPGAGHQVSQEVIINGMDQIVHFCRIFGAVSNIEYTNFNYEPENPALTVFIPVRFKIGDGGPNTPLANQNSATTPELAGLTIDQFIIHRANYGPLLPNIHYDFDTGSGEWNLLLENDVFGEVEEFTIDIKPVITNNVNDSVVGKLFGGFVDVAANVDYLPAHLRKLIRFSGSPEYSFLVNPPIGYLHAFQHFGAAGTAKINFTNGVLLYGGAPKASIDFPRYRTMGFTWDGANWNAIYLVDATWVDGVGAPQPGAILGVGKFNVGDVPGGDPVYTITHGLAIAGDYMIIPTIESNNAALYHRDNRIGICWFHHAADKPNKINVSLQELGTEAQNVSISFLIVKR